MRFFYTLKTLDPIIVSQTTATTQNHMCLDYIPGSAILGAMAASLYSTLSKEESWQLFHSGACKFGPCYPVVNGEVALPMPASWHFPKGEEFIKPQTDTLNTSVLSNHASSSLDRDKNVQYKQCREGYVASSSHIGSVRLGLSTKTAIDDVSGRAKDGQLFSYSYIESQQTFGGWIDTENDTQAEQLKAVLGNVIRIGRSRNTEFGRVEVAINSEKLHPEPNANKQQLFLWCLSDCELINAQGMPTLRPNANDIHSELSGQLNRQQSFIRSEKVSRFNQKRQGLDSEQVLISKGSILVFDLDKELSPALLASIDQSGIGINRQQGLGWVSANPLWSLSPTIHTNELFLALPVSTNDMAPVNGSSSLLTEWLSERMQQEAALTANQQRVNDIICDICKAYSNARSYNNILNRNEAGPSVTQWRRIQNQVHTQNEQWNVDVFSGQHAICKVDSGELGWGINWYDQSLTNFASHIKNLLAKESAATMTLLLEQLCRYDLSTYKGLKKLVKELNLFMKAV